MRESEACALFKAESNGHPYVSQTAALSLREDVYRSAFHSTSNYGMCAQEVATKGSARETLDRIFNVCLADYAPFTADGSKRADASEFPPFHPEVERGQ